MARGRRRGGSLRGMLPACVAFLVVAAACGKIAGIDELEIGECKGGKCGAEAGSDGTVSMLSVWRIASSKIGVSVVSMRSVTMAKRLAIALSRVELRSPSGSGRASSRGAAIAAAIRPLTRPGRMPRRR